MTADLALIASDPSVAEQSADPGQYVVIACERAKEWLTHALDGAHIEEIVEVKSQAEAIRVYTTQKQLGKDAELSAAEVVRRAERGIGLAIRKGQEAGDIADKGSGRSAAGRASHKTGDTSFMPPSPTQFATSDELSGNGAGIYQMTDGVSDDDFDAAVDEAKDEGNLSRANIVRKVRKSPETRRQRADAISEMAAEGYRSDQIADKLGVHIETVKTTAKDHGVRIPADEITRRSRHIDSTRVARQTVFALEGAAAGLNLIDYSDIDMSEVADWATSLTESMRALNRFVRKIKEMDQ